MKYISHLVIGKFAERSQAGITRRAAMMREAVSTREFIAVLSVYPPMQWISKKTRFSESQRPQLEDL
jgi:hypothetical protein